MYWINTSELKSKSGEPKAQAHVKLENGKKIPIPHFNIPMFEEKDFDAYVLKEISEKSKKSIATILWWCSWAYKNRTEGIVGNSIRMAHEPPKSLGSMYQKCSDRILLLICRDGQQDRGKELFTLLQNVKGDKTKLTKLYTELFPVDLEE